MFFFVRARTGKGFMRHINVNSFVWTLINSGKLANQILRLASMVVKHTSHALFTVLAGYSKQFEDLWLYLDCVRSCGN